MSQPVQDLTTTNEIANDLKRAPETLVRWRRQRVGPPYIRVQGRILYSRKQVQQWLESKTCKAAGA
jgi:hypothetical protein